MDIVVVTPDNFEEVAAFLRMADSLTEIEKKLELCRGERERLFIEVESEVVFIEAEGAERKDDRTRR
jgi:tetrahydromethanopterin S-methyltransferase subunit G